MLKSKILISSIFFILITLLLYSNIQSLYNNCFSAVDYGIYLQMIKEIGEFKLNPYLSIRAINAFNDHVDPIIFVPAILSKVIGSPNWFLLLFEWVVILIIPCFYLYKKFRVVNSKELFFGLLFIFFSKSLLIALRFPVHPTTWASVPLFFLSYGLIKRKYTISLIFALSLIFFKESFPFLLLTFSFFMLKEKKFYHFVTLFLVGTLSIYFCNFLRPELLGPVVNYKHEIFNGIENGFLSFVIIKILNFDYLKLIKNFFPLIIYLSYFIYQSIREKVKGNLTALLGTTLAILPLFAIQFLGNRFDFQYGAQFYGALLPFVLFTSIKDKIIANNKLYFSLIILIFINGFSEYEKVISQVIFAKKKDCEISLEKINDTESFIKAFNQIDLSHDIASSSGIINQILKPNMKIHHIGGYSRIPIQFKYLLLEENKNDYSWPTSFELRMTYKKNCSPFVTNIIYSSRYYFLAEGNFPRSCLE